MSKNHKSTQENMFESFGGKTKSFLVELQI